MINKKFIRGFAFNRKHFHTNTNACIICACWSNEEDVKTEVLSVDGYDIDKSNNLVYCGVLDLKRIHYLFSEKYYDKNLPSDVSTDGILVRLNGLEELNDNKKTANPYYHKDFIGYLVAQSFGFDNPDAKSSLLISGRYDAHGFYLKRDNFLDKLPMFASSRYIRYNSGWTERARVMKSTDGYSRFVASLKTPKMKNYLLKVLLFSCLEPQNHMRTIIGSDKRKYRNELSLDTTHGETCASTALKNLKPNQDEKKLIELYNSILLEVKKTDEYNKELTYGVYQINQEINVSYVDEKGNKVYKYPILNGLLNSLKSLIKDYYNKEIVPTLFEYEFLK